MIKYPWILTRAWYGEGLTLQKEKHPFRVRVNSSSFCWMKIKLSEYLVSGTKTRRINIKLGFQWIVCKFNFYRENSRMRYKKLRCRQSSIWHWLGEWKESLGGWMVCLIVQRALLQVNFFSVFCSGKCWFSFCLFFFLVKSCSGTFRPSTSLKLIRTLRRNSN